MLHEVVVRTCEMLHVVIVFTCQMLYVADEYADLRCYKLLLSMLLFSMYISNVICNCFSCTTQMLYIAVVYTHKI